MANRRDYQMMFEIAAHTASNFKSDMNAASSAIDKIRDKLRQAAEQSAAFDKIKTASEKLNAAKANVEKYTQAVEAAKAALDKSKAATQQSIQAHRDAQNALKSAQNEVKLYTDAQKNLDRQYKNGKISLDEYNRMTKSLEGSLQAAEAKERRYAEDVKTTKTAMDNARSAESKRNGELKTAEKNLRSATNETKNYEAEIEKLNSRIASGPFAGMTQAQVDAYRKNLQDSLANYDKWSDSYDRWKSGLQTSWSSLLRTVNVVSMGASAAYNKLIAPTVDFEKRISAVSAAAGGSQSTTEAIRSSARELGRTTVFSASEVAEGYEVTALAGWSPAEMLSGMSGLLSLASASGEDLAAVTEIASDTMTAFGVSYDQTQRFADVLAKVATMTTTDVTQMGDTFQYVAPLAGTLGYQIEDVAAAMGIMANRAIKGSLAGTSIRNILTNLAAPTKNTQEAMDALGISLTDGEGKAKSFRQTFAEMREAFAPLSESEQTEMAFKIAGKRGMSGLLALVNASDEDYDAMFEALDHVSGAADEMAKIKLDNLAGDIQLMKDAGSDLSLTFGEAVTPAMREATQGFTELINALNAKISQNPEALVGVLKTVAGAAAGVVGIKGLNFGVNLLGTGISGIGKLATGAKLLKTSVIGAGGSGLAKLANGMKEASKGIDATTASSAGLVAKALLAHPALLAVGAGLAVAGGSAYVLYKNNEKLIQQNMTEHFGSVSLSLADIDKIIDNMFYDRKVERFASAMESVAAAEQSLKETRESYDKQTYLSGTMGLGLDADESDAYAKTVESYIAGLKNYLKENAYELNLIYEDLGIKLDPENNVYIDAYDKAGKIGEQIAEALNEALEDGIITPIEEEAIDAKVRELTEIYERFENAKKEAAFNADNAGYIAEYVGSAMDSESFKALQKQLDTRAQERYQEIYAQYLTRDSELLSAANAAAAEYRESGSVDDYNAWQYALDTYTTFHADLEGGKYTGEMLAPFISSIQLQTQQLEQAYPQLAAAISENKDKISAAIAGWRAQGFTDTDISNKTKRMITRFGNFSDKDIEGLSRFLESTANTLSSARQIAENFGMNESEFNEMFGGYSSLFTLLGNVEGATPWKFLTNLFGDADGGIHISPGSIEGTAEIINAIGGAAGAAAYTVNTVGGALANVTGKTEGLRGALETITGNPLINLLHNFTDLGPEIDEQTGKVITFGDEVNNIPSNKTVKINVETESAYSMVGGITSGLGSLTDILHAILPGHAGGTNYTEEAFIAGEGGKPELITGAAGRTVFTGAETSAMLRAQRDVQEAAMFAPLVLDAALSGGGGGPTIIINSNPTISGSNAGEIAAAQYAVNEDLVQQIVRALEDRAHDRARRSRF